MNHHNQLKTGRDPRALPDYAALRDELAKLNHPARPDINWSLVEQLSLSLFRQNGVELQTLSWYTLARTRLAGMAGLNEGLAILEVLLTRQWGVLWPQPVHARIEILAGLSQRLQSMLRTFILQYSDLPQVYQAEQYLTVLRDTLQRLELKNASQMEELCTFMHNAATRLENMNTGNDASAAVVIPVASRGAEIPASDGGEPLIYVAHEDPVAPRILIAHPAPVPAPPWRSFSAGMLTMLVAGCVAVWGWHRISPVPPSPVPVVANEATLFTLEKLPTLWRQDYGFQLAGRAEPAEAEKLKAQWQHYLVGNALSPEALSGWHQGMAGLNEMTRRLNALDERKGKYLTGSELKSMVFTITQNFARAEPVEERLYQMSLVGSETRISARQRAQTDMHLNQLLNRYALIIQSDSSALYGGSKPSEINRTGFSGD